VFEAALTYEAETGVIEVVANTLDDRKDLTAFMARDLLGIDFKEKHIPWREYDLSMLLKPFDFPTDPEDGIMGVTVKELRLMDVSAPEERVTLETMSGAKRTIWEMADDFFLSGGYPKLATAHMTANRMLSPGWIITRARFTIKFYPGPEGGRGKSLTLTVTMPHGCNLKDMTPHERLIGEKYLRRWGILTDTADIGDLVD